MKQAAKFLGVAVVTVIITLGGSTTWADHGHYGGGHYGGDHGGI